MSPKEGQPIPLRPPHRPVERELGRRSILIPFKQPQLPSDSDKRPKLTPKHIAEPLKHTPNLNKIENNDILGYL